MKVRDKIPRRSHERSVCKADGRGTLSCGSHTDRETDGAVFQIL